MTEYKIFLSLCNTFGVFSHLTIEVIKMKKIIAIVLSLILVVTSGVVLASCRKK